ncbi:MAG: hypothetical protein HRT77_09760 [Halioglobus sp.]|nr:hypothetical protein [Halioglobus sp.]
MISLSYFWRVNTQQIAILFAGPPLLAVAVVVSSSRWINRRYEKQQLLVWSCTPGALNMLWLTPLQLLNLMPQRQEGILFAAASFANKFITGFGYLVAGPFLDFIGLEPGTPPGKAPYCPKITCYAAFTA